MNQLADTIAFIVNEATEKEIEAIRTILESCRPKKAFDDPRKRSSDLQNLRAFKATAAEPISAGQVVSILHSGPIDENVSPAQLSGHEDPRDHTPENPGWIEPGTQPKPAQQPLPGAQPKAKKMLQTPPHRWGADEVHELCDLLVNCDWNTKAATDLFMNRNGRKSDITLSHQRTKTIAAKCVRALTVNEDDPKSTVYRNHVKDWLKKRQETPKLPGGAKVVL